MEKMNKEDLNSLKKAVNILENPTLTSKISDLIGMPVEKAFEYLPKKWRDKISSSTNSALKKALEIVVLSMNNNFRGNTFHKLLSGTSGMIGGFFGLPGLSVELPISTSIILRSIADIAKSEGEDLSDIEVKLSCLEVFALGGNSKEDDASESGYFAVRATLATAITDASRHIIQKGLSEESAPILVRFLMKISSRFSIQVSEKVASQTIPVIGAAGGAIINLLFIDHFQNIAWGHFTIRRLERTYEKEFIKNEYEKIMYKNKKK